MTMRLYANGVSRILDPSGPKYGTLPMLWLQRLSQRSEPLQFFNSMSIVPYSNLRRCRFLLKMLLCSLAQLSFKEPS